MDLARVGTGGRRVNPEKRLRVPGGCAGLDEVAEDPEDLLGIGDDWPLAALARCCRLRRGPASGNHSGYSARGYRCPLRSQLPPTRSTSYTFASSRAQAERDALTDTD